MHRKMGFFLFSLLTLSLGVTLASWPVNVVSMNVDGEGTFFSSPVPEGWGFRSRIIHSLEKTPVEDDYRVVCGRIWQWEERYRSNNAGLPTEVPRNGRFLSCPGWFVIRGGRNAWDLLFYRVGNSDLGKNILSADGFGLFRLYELVPGKKLSLRVISIPLALSSRVLRQQDLR